MNDSADLLDVVALTTDLPDHGLQRGRVGTVVEILKPGIVDVEFSDDDGRAVAFVAIDTSNLLVLHYEPVSTAPEP